MILPHRVHSYRGQIIHDFTNLIYLFTVNTAICSTTRLRDAIIRQIYKWAGLQVSMMILAINNDQHKNSGGNLQIDTYFMLSKCLEDVLYIHQCLYIPCSLPVYGFKDTTNSLLCVVQ